MNQKIAVITASAIAIAVMLGIGGYVIWQNFPKTVETTAPVPMVTASTPETKVPSAKNTGTELALTRADCGNWQYLNALKDPLQPTWTFKQPCASELSARDGSIFGIAQADAGQSAAELYFELPSNIDGSRVTSLSGEIIGTCQRQFEIKTADARGQWKPVGIIPCPPDYSEAIDYSFTPEVHNGTVGVLIVSGDNFNNLQMDQVSVRAVY